MPGGCAHGRTRQVGGLCTNSCRIAWAGEGEQGPSSMRDKGTSYYSMDSSHEQLSDKGPFGVGAAKCTDISRSEQIVSKRGASWTGHMRTWCSASVPPPPSRTTKCAGSHLVQFPVTRRPTHCEVFGGYVMVIEVAVVLVMHDTLSSKWLGYQVSSRLLPWPCQRLARMPWSRLSKLVANGERHRLLCRCRCIPPPRPIVSFRAISVPPCGGSVLCGSFWTTCALWSCWGLKLP